MALTSQRILSPLCLPNSTTPAFGNLRNIQELTFSGQEQISGELVNPAFLQSQVYHPVEPADHLRWILHLNSLNKESLFIEQAADIAK